MEDKNRQDYLTYEDIRKIAIANGVKDNRVSVGIWAKLNGFSNRRKMHKGTTQIIYTKGNNPNNGQIEKRNIALMEKNNNDTGISNISVHISFNTENKR